jgi:hypothetical protein
MSYDQLNDDPPAKTWAWNVAYRGEPAKGKSTVIVNVRVTREFARSGMGTIAAALERRFGWVVHRHAGWGTHERCDEPDGLVVLSVTVRAREIKAALATVS